MIGPEWSGEGDSGGDAGGDVGGDVGGRGPTRAREARSAVRVVVVTGSRAEFGLLTPVMRAIGERSDLELQVIAAGSHLAPPAQTFRDVKKQFEVADSVPMQVSGRVGRMADVEALGRGIARFGRSFEHLQPDWVVVLGDRIEAFAAASAASVGGIALAHLHGGDVAEGVADEAMRHAITKLAHLHLPATEGAAGRIRAMGERAEHVVVVGSPAIDGLSAVEAMGDAAAAELGDPGVLLLLHPVGRSDEREEAVASACLEACLTAGGGRVLWMGPNLDAGRNGIVRAWREAGDGGHVVAREHLERGVFVSLLKRLASRGGVMVGNSSSALIEAQAVGVPAVNVGPRQGGRERGSGVVHATGETAEAVAEAIERTRGVDRSGITHPFGDGKAGVRAAAAIAEIGFATGGLLRKRSVF